MIIRTRGQALTGIPLAFYSYLHILVKSLSVPRLSKEFHWLFSQRIFGKRYNTGMSNLAIAIHNLSKTFDNGKNVVKAVIDLDLEIQTR